jgi:predicted transcriptional regulator
MGNITSIFAGAQRFDFATAAKAAFAIETNDATAVAVLLALAGWTEPSGIVIASYAELARRVRKHARTVQRAMRNVFDSGLIQRSDDPRLVCVYSWDLERVNALAANDRRAPARESVKIHARAVSTDAVDRGPTVDLTTSEIFLAAFNRLARQALKRDGRVTDDRAYMAQTRFAKAANAAQVSAWITSYSEAHDCTPTEAAEHLARVYIDDSRARPTGRAWEQGLPVDWVVHVLQLAATTRRRAPAKPSTPQAAIPQAATPTTDAEGRRPAGRTEQGAAKFDRASVVRAAQDAIASVGRGVKRAGGLR